MQLHCRVRFSASLVSDARLDPYSFQGKKEGLVRGEEVQRWEIRHEERFGMREMAYLTLLLIAEQEAEIERTGNSLHCSSASRSYISEEDIELLNREEEKLPQHFELVLPSALYGPDSLARLRERCELPSLTVIGNCIAFVDALFRDILSICGSESILAELLILAVTLTYFQEKDINKCIQLLRRMGEILTQCVQFPAELAISYHLWQGIISETENITESEQHFVTALLLMTQLYGDPRGRGNIGVPWQMLVASKLSILCRDDGRIQDAVLAEEHFDAAYISTKQYREMTYAQSHWKRTNTRTEEISMKFPFEHWSSFTPNRSRGSISFDDPAVDNWEGYFACVLQNHLPMFPSGVNWSNVEYKAMLKSVKLQTGTVQTFVDSLGREIKRPAMQQSTLSQLLAMEQGVVSVAKMQGVVYVWGSDSHGQLGLSVTQDPHTDLRMPVPRLLTSLKDEVIKEIAIGADHCVAVSIDGRAWTWGDNSKGQLGLGQEAPAVVGAPALIKTINNVMQASCGYTHTLLLTGEGQVHSCGSAEKGLLGHGNTVSVYFPKLITALRAVKIKHVECGGFHSVAITSEGTLYTWGEAQGGQLGISMDTIQRRMQDSSISEMYIHTPIRVTGLLTGKRNLQVACGEAHTLALTVDGDVWAWGQNSNGQLGLGLSSETYAAGRGDELSTRYEPTVVKAVAGLGVCSVAASGVYSMFVTSDGTVYACGANDFYKLGLEIRPRETSDIAIPTKLDVFMGSKISQVACGIDHALGLTTEPHGLVWSWGKNREGQLGIGTDTQYASPRPLPSMSNAQVYKAICGNSTSLVIIGSPMELRKSRQEDLEQNWGVLLSDVST